MNRDFQLNTEADGFLLEAVAECSIGCRSLFARTSRGFRSKNADMSSDK